MKAKALGPKKKKRDAEYNHRIKTIKTEGFSILNFKFQRKITDYKRKQI